MARKALFVGYANIDVIARLRSPLKRGERLTATQIDKMPGGMAANAACAAAAVGIPAIFCGSVGRDPFGKVIIEDFRRFGVRLCPGARRSRTTLCLIGVYPDGERFIISEPSDFDSKALRRYLAQADDGLEGGVLYVDGYHIGKIREELDQARVQGLRVFCDVDGGPEAYTSGELLAHLAKVDVALVNPAVLAFLFGEHPLEEGCRRLLTLVPQVILTRGSKEVYLFTRWKSRRFTVSPARRIVDTIGAGDVFSGVFVAFWVSGKSLEEAVEAAIKAATISVEYPGARGGLGAIRQILQAQ